MMLNLIFLYCILCIIPFKYRVFFFDVPKLIFNRFPPN